MGTVGIRMAASAAVAVASLLATAPANAGDSVDLGSVNGLNYRVVTSEVQPATGVDTYAACGMGDVALSGGIDIVDPEFSPGVPDGATMGDTHPDVDGEASVWRSSAANEGDGPVEMRFFAICTDSSEVLTRKNKVRVRPGARGKVRSGCPANYQAAGGGIRAAGPLLASVPFDDDDPNKRPDDGWRASTYNGGPDPISLAAFASCVRASEWSLTYLRHGTATQAGHLVHSGALCPEGAALTGLGAKARGGEGPHDISIRELYPENDFLPEGDAPSEAMLAGFRAESNALAGMTAVGICKG